MRSTPRWDGSIYTETPEGDSRAVENAFAATKSTTVCVGFEVQGEYPIMMARMRRIMDRTLAAASNTPAHQDIHVVRSSRSKM